MDDGPRPAPRGERAPQLLDAATTARLRAEELTYTRPSDPAVVPDGFHHFSRAQRILRTDLDGAATDLLGWRVHARAGLEVASSVPSAAPGEVVLMRLGLGPLALRIPCRVLEVIDEPDRRGFVYGTLPGHPESGEESFVLERQPDGSIDFVVAAYSRPASFLARAGGPASRAMQRFMTGRYLAAPDRLV